jgi:hypothetical protein
LWSDQGDSDATLTEPQPVELDEPWVYSFRVSLRIFFVRHDQCPGGLLMQVWMPRSPESQSGFARSVATGIPAKFPAKQHERDKHDRCPTVICAGAAASANCLGAVVCRQKEGLFYPVIFNDKIRKYFAPLNGEIKPDTPHVRGLLKEAGWL